MNDVVGSYGLVVRFTVKTGSEAAFDELAADMVRHVRESEPGTSLYLCHQVVGQPQQRIFYELYRDRAAFDAHEDQLHTRRFLAARDELLDDITVDFLIRGADLSAAP